MDEILTWSSCDRNSVGVSRPRASSCTLTHYSLTPKGAFIRATPPNLSCQRNSASAAFLRSRSPRWPAGSQPMSFDRAAVAYPIEKTRILGQGYRRETFASISGRGTRTRGRREVCRGYTCGERSCPRGLGTGQLGHPRPLYGLGGIAEQDRNEVSGVNVRNLSPVAGSHHPWGWVTDAHGLKDNRRPITPSMAPNMQSRAPRSGIAI